VFVCLIPLGVEQSWQGDFLSLARNFSWMHYAGAERGRRIILKIDRIIIETPLSASLRLASRERAAVSVIAMGLWHYPEADTHPHSVQGAVLGEVEDLSKTEKPRMNHSVPLMTRLHHDRAVADPADNSPP
jgi:hypothetical protein